MMDLIVKLLGMFANVLAVLLKDNRKMQRAVIWLVFALVPAIGLSVIWILLATRVTAVLIAPAATDWVTYTEMLAWIVGVFGVLFGVVCGHFFPGFGSDLIEKLAPNSNANLSHESTQQPAGGEER